jgi:hypothetical protein
MAMNRRNVLIGLGTVAAGGGAVLGTGAFSTVEAQRTVTLESTGDDSANLGLTPGSGAGEIVDDGSNQITFDEKDLNENALTTYTDALQIANNDAGETIGVWVTDQNDIGSVLDFRKSDGTSIVESNPSSANLTIDSDGNELVTVVVDNRTTDLSSATISPVTVNADTDATP